jgi:hypothetical protein
MGNVNSIFGPPPITSPVLADKPSLPHSAFVQWFSSIFQQIAWGNIVQSGVTVGNVITPRVFQCTQANLATIAAGLSAVDIGALAWVTDYDHLLQWTGTGWQWGPGESGSGMLVPFAVAPTGNGWHTCDGSSQNYLKSNGTTGSVTLPNVAGGAYLKAGSGYNSTITAAVPPIISQPTFTGTPNTTGTTVGASSSGTTANTLTQSHSHTFTPTGIVSQPIATLPGDPIANFEVLLYFRK